MTHLYLDNNATTRIDPLVAADMADCFAKGYVNPASQHQLGQQARRALEQAREGIAEILGAHCSGVNADPIIFTSGGTEANNLLLLGLAGRPPGRIIISAIEHPSIVGAAEELARRDFEVVRLPVSTAGVVQRDALRPLLSDGTTKLVSVMLANNETGVLQPLEEISSLCAEFQVPLHTDAVQVIGKLPVNFRELGVAAMTIAAHKFHGPVGIGALVMRHGLPIEPQLHGGFQQASLRPGTESLALAIGMHRALALWHAEAAERSARMTALRDSFEATLLANVPEIVINGREAARLPNTSNVSFVGLDRQSLLLALDMAGIACSTGSACASGSSEPSPVLTAMGLSTPRISSALRFSFSAQTTAAEVAESARRIIPVCQHLRRPSPSRKSPSPARQ